MDKKIVFAFFLMIEVIFQTLYVTGEMADNITTVKVEIPDNIISTGDTFIVNISCKPVIPIKAFEFKLLFDPTILHANYVIEGDIFNSYTTFFNPGDIDNINGSIDNIYDLIVGEGNVNNTGVLVSISFNAKESTGNSILDLYDVGISDGLDYISINVFNGVVPVVKKNIYPSLSIVNPVNGSIGVPIILDAIVIDIYDFDGDLLNWSISTFPDIGSSYGINELNGKKFCNVSNLFYNTTYKCNVTVSDGDSIVKEIYFFKTEVDESDTTYGPYDLIFTESGSGSGIVEVNYSGPYYYGDTVIVWANASVGSRFAGFDGSLSGLTSPQSLVIDGDEYVEVLFSLDGPYDLIFTESGSGSGIVEVNYSGPYYYGDTVIVWANASVGSRFAGFDGSLSGLTSPQSLVIDEDETIEYVFVLNELPFAYFTYLPIEPGNTDMIYFEDCSYDNDGSILGWFWSFGDGNISTLQNPSHKYSEPGSYNVSLRVWDNDQGFQTFVNKLIVRSTDLTEILDQEQTTLFKNSVFYGSTIRAQSFKPSLSKLTKIELLIKKVGSPGNLIVSVRELINESDIVSIIVPAENILPIYGLVEINIPDLDVIPDNQYYIIVECEIGDKNSYYYWGYTNFNPYDEGSFWATHKNSLSWKEFFNQDYCFITYGI